MLLNPLESMQMEYPTPSLPTITHLLFTADHSTHCSSSSCRRVIKWPRLLFSAGSCRFSGITDTKGTSPISRETRKREKSKVVSVLSIVSVSHSFLLSFTASFARCCTTLKLKTWSKTQAEAVTATRSILVESLHATATLLNP